MLYFLPPEKREFGLKRFFLINLSEYALSELCKAKGNRSLASSFSSSFSSILFKFEKELFFLLRK